MKYETLDQVTGVGKFIRIRDKYTRVPFIVGVIKDEVSVSDGEQKQVIQFVALADRTVCERDPTRFVLRVAYYSRWADGWFCLGSQFAPIRSCRLRRRSPTVSRLPHPLGADGLEL